MTKYEAFLLVIMAHGAYFIPFISRRLMLPSAVGEIFFGMVIGTLIPGEMRETNTISFLSELGFIVLMYLAGLEINFERIRRIPKRDISLFLMMFLLLIMAAAGVTALLDQKPIMALVYMTTAVGLLFPVLKDAGLMEHDTGQTLLILGSIGEVISLLGLTGFTLAYQFGLSMKTVIHLGELVLFTLLAFFILRIAKLFLWWYPERFSLFVTTGNVTETGIRANFVNMFVFVALAEFFEIEVIVGAFIGGMLFAMLFHDREHIMEKLAGFGYGFLIPIFFIDVGMRFKLTDFADMQVLLIAVTTSIIMLVIRWVAVFPLFWSKLPRRAVKLVPYALSFPLTLLVAISTLGNQSGIFDKTESAGVILAAIITALVYPWAFKVLAKQSGVR